MRLVLTLLIAATLARASASAGEKSDDLPPEMQLAAAPTRAPEPEANPSTPAKIALGRKLFFDPILSGTQTVACATCHHPDHAWGDGRAVPIGVGGKGIGPARVNTGKSPFAPIKRNSPSLLNVAFHGMVYGKVTDPTAAPMFWDGRVSGLEAQVPAPIRNAEEMRGTACTEAQALPQAVARVAKIADYQHRFAQAFPGPTSTSPITAEHLTQAIAAFERILIAVETPYDQFMRGDKNALTSQQQRGLQLFRQAGCQHCHGGPMFSDFKLHVIAAPDADPAARREFRTPTLRNLSHTAPYMHNGSLKTLDDVLAFYEQLSDTASETLDGADQTQHPPLDPLLKKLNLTPQDFPALKAVLESLNDHHSDRTQPASVPSGLPVGGG